MIYVLSTLNQIEVGEISALRILAAERNHVSDIIGRYVGQYLSKNMHAATIETLNKWLNNAYAREVKLFL
jgi:hypothetical protein